MLCVSRLISMNGHSENNWIRVRKAWPDPPIFESKQLNEENQLSTSYGVSHDSDHKALNKADTEGMPLSHETEMEKEEDAASDGPPVCRKQLTPVTGSAQGIPLPQFVDALKNLVELAPTVLQREEQEREAQWAEARDESLRVMEEGLTTLQRDVAQNLMSIMDSLERSQCLRRRTRETERRSEKERWRKSRAETEKWMKRWVEKWEGKRRAEGWTCEGEEEDEEDVSKMCLEVTRQVLMVMDKSESKREEEVTESQNSAAKQDLASMEVLMDELEGVEEVCRRHSKKIQDRMVHLWETIEKNRAMRPAGSGLTEQYSGPGSWTALAADEPLIVEEDGFSTPEPVRTPSVPSPLLTPNPPASTAPLPSLVCRRRRLLPPITPLTEDGLQARAQEGARGTTLHTTAGSAAPGMMWHMEPLAENHREKRKRKKKKRVEKKDEEDSQPEDKSEETEPCRKTWKERFIQWLHTPLCGCAVKCY